jgi:hypothetical protein
MTDSTARAAASVAAVRVGDATLGVLFVVAGVAILWLALFSDGVLVGLVFGLGPGHAAMHDLLHDGRHLGSVPCH